jgi:hypothetical protein
MAAPILTDVRFRSDVLDAEQTNRVAGLNRRAADERTLTEDESFLIEHAMQLDFEMINDDGTVFACTQAQLVALVRARGGQIERIKKPD